MRAEGKVNHILGMWHLIWLTVILLVAVLLRLGLVADLSHGSIKFAGTCGQLFDEVKPLVDAKNPLHFEVFFYPPVPALIVGSTAIIAEAFFKDAFDLGRYCLFLNVGFSVATVALVYLIGKEWGPNVGLVAASFYAVTMIAVHSCNNVQVYPTFFAMFAIYFFYRALRKPSTVNLTAMGVLLGLGVASKYFPVMLFILLFLVHFVLRRDSPYGRMEGLLRREQRQTSGSIASLAWSGMLYGVVLTMLVLLYVGTFHKESLMAVFKAIYEDHQHDHPFEYHLSTITRFYNAGLIAIGCVSVIAGLGIFLPTLAKLSPWEWFQRFHQRNRFWLIPSSSMIGTVIITLGIPAALNLNNYLRYTTWIAKSYTSSDSGMFPQGSPAPSYLLAFFPENLGIPLFILGCLGIMYCVYTRDEKATLLMIASLPLYIMLELSSVKVNRFALDIMPLFCLFGAILIVRIAELKSSAMSRAISCATFLIVFMYSASYSLAWVNFERNKGNALVETTGWVNTHVKPGSTIGMRANFWILGSENLLPDPEKLARYPIASMSNYPDYILLPKLVYQITKQYVELTQAGYSFKPEDWSPQLPPSPEEKMVFIDLIHQKHYQLVAEFEKTPGILGVTFPSQTLTGRTWFLEHEGPYGIQIYKKRAGDKPLTSHETPKTE